MRVGRTQVPVLALAGVAGRTGGGDAGAAKLGECLFHVRGAETEGEDPLAARRQERPRRLRLVVRLEQLEETVLRAQEDAAGADRRDVADAVHAREAEATLVQPERTLQVADYQDQVLEVRHGRSPSSAPAPRPGGSRARSGW